MKKYLVSIAGLLGIVLVIVGVKGSQFFSLYKMAETMVMPLTVISSMPVQEQSWEQTLNTVGTLEAVQGVVVTADMPGRVTEILFKAGAEVNAGDVLIRQDTSSEQAQLRAAEASVALAKTNLDRIEALLAKKVSSKSEFDTSEARYKEVVAQADNIRTSIDKKTVKAPFAGRLGIRLINVGSDLGTGSSIVSLQAVDPIYVNFSLPQRDLSMLQLGLEVRLETDAVPGKAYSGKISAINPEIDPVTRSVRVQASLSNEDLSLLPGMYANLRVVLPETEQVLAVPVTAVAYATFGDSIFVIAEEKDEKSGKMQQVARQQFVRLGKTRGDFVAVAAGVSASDTVVSTGVFKLRNGAPVIINNEALPDFSLNPDPEDS
ncbi:efflux RND transporter periplasmic adaptor subunit [Teredinibacter haidensis]|uniref:efflux RND transporter periplasmic adaptor subunit n=1 Tax=Teredinibacter haidensis TaxID=2731755 RepID=UPI000949087E|nr:efflux RND transporter periplasmic adaptor subunit [Teredinibacter haidensis]